MDIPHKTIGLNEQLWNCIGCPGAKGDDEKGTLYVDSAHDGLSPLLSAPSNYEDVMFDNTVKDDVNPISTHPEYFEEINIDDDLPNFGYYPENNDCYIIDVIRKGTYLKGLNQFLDSASTGHTGEFIEGCINKFMAPTTTYKDVTDIDKTKAGELYLFQFFNSKLNIPTQNRFDYTAYTNFDILIFFHAMKKIGLDFGATAASMSIFNKLLNRKESDAIKNKEIQKNKFILINAIGLNYLWQNLMTYCNNLIDHGKYNDLKQKCTSLLRHIMFVNFIIEPTKNTQYATYSIGYGNPTISTSIDVNDFDLDLNDKLLVKNLIKKVSTEIYYKLTLDNTGSAKDSSIYPIDFPYNDEEHTFYTSQSMCCSEMQKIDSTIKTLDNRNPEAGNINRDKMKIGIDKLFSLCPDTSIINKDFKLYFYRILKFQGDTSHLVFSKIIDKSKEDKLIFNGSYSIGSTTLTINRLIITGERPLYCRAIQDELSIRSKKFVKYKQILGLNDKGEKTVQNNADVCQYFSSIYTQLNKICNKGSYDSAIGYKSNTEVKDFTRTVFKTLKNGKSQSQIDTEAYEDIIIECVEHCRKMYTPFIEYYNTKIGEGNTKDNNGEIFRIIKEIEKLDDYNLTTDEDKCKENLIKLHAIKNGDLIIPVKNLDNSGDLKDESIKIPKNYQYYNNLYNEFIKFKYVLTDISIILPSIITLGKINISGAYGDTAKKIIKSASYSFVYLTNLFNYDATYGCLSSGAHSVSTFELFNNDVFNDIANNAEFKEHAEHLFCKTKKIFDKIKDLIIAVHKDCFITQFPERMFIKYNKEWALDLNNKNMKVLKEVIHKPLWYYEYSFLDEENNAKQSYIDLIKRSIRVKFTKSNNSDDNLNIDKVTIDTYTDLIIYFCNKCNNLPKSSNILMNDEYKIFNKIINKNLENFKLIDIICEILKYIGDIREFDTLDSLNHAINNIKSIFNKFDDAMLSHDKDDSIGYTDDVIIQLNKAKVLITTKYFDFDDPNKAVTDNGLYNNIYPNIIKKGKEIIDEINNIMAAPAHIKKIQNTEIDIKEIICNKIKLYCSLSILYNLFYYTFYFINQPDDKGNIVSMNEDISGVQTTIENRINTYYANTHAQYGITDPELIKQFKINKKIKSLIIHKLDGSKVKPETESLATIDVKKSGTTTTIFSDILNAKQLKIYQSLGNIRKLIHNQCLLWSHSSTSIPAIIISVLNNTEYFYIDLDNSIQKFNSKLVGLPSKGGSTELIKYVGGTIEPKYQKKIDKIMIEINRCISFFKPEVLKNKILKSKIDIIMKDYSDFNIEDRLINEPLIKQYYNEKGITDYLKFREGIEETKGWMKHVFDGINKLKYTASGTEHNLAVSGYTIDNKSQAFYNSRINAIKHYIIAYNIQIQEFINTYFRTIKFLIFGFNTLETIFGLIELIDNTTEQYIKYEINKITVLPIKEFLINLVENRRNARNFADHLEIISIFCNNIQITNSGQFLIIYNIITCIVNETYIEPYYNISNYEINDFMNNLYKLYNEDKYEIENLQGADANNISAYKKKRKQIIDGLKYIYSDYKIREFLNMDVKHYNIVEFIFGVKYIVQDPYSYTVKELYDEVIKNYNRVRMINTTANIADKIKDLNIDIPSFLKIHFSQYQILRLLLSFDLNYYTLEESVFESWEEIVLSDIRLDSVVGNFLIPNKTVPYLDKLDHKYSSAISNQKTEGDSSFANFVNCFKHEKTSKIKYKYCSTIDFILSMFKRCNLFITNDEEEVYNDIKIDELYGLYKVLTLNSDICNKLVEKM